MGVGSSVVINGELRAAEDLTIMGRVEGTIHLEGHTLTIGVGAQVHAEVVAKSVIVLGSVTGQVTALERLDVQPGGQIEGTVTTARLSLADGAILQGAVMMPERNAGAPKT